LNENEIRYYIRAYSLAYEQVEEIIKGMEEELNKAQI